MSTPSSNSAASLVIPAATASLKELSAPLLVESGVGSVGDCNRGNDAGLILGADEVKCVDTVLGEPPGTPRSGDLATKTNLDLGACGAIAHRCLSGVEGGGGVFVWSSAPITDDGGTFIVPDGAGAGHIGATGSGWRRIYSGPIDVQWFGTGSTDDTKSIQAAVDAVPAAGGEVLFPAGSYRTTATITVNRSDITLRGVGGASQIHATVSKLAALVFTHASRVQANRLQIMGKFTIGIWLESCAVAKVTDCIISGATDLGDECAGIRMSACTDVWISENYLSGNGLGPTGSSSADIGTATGTLTNERITIVDNHCISTAANVNIGLWNATHLVIEGNHCSGAVCQKVTMDGVERDDVSGGYGIMVYKTMAVDALDFRGDAVISGNVIQDVEGTGIYVQSCPRCVISGNRIENSCTKQVPDYLLVGAIAVNAGPATISGNQIRQSKQAGIVVLGQGVTASGNTVNEAFVGILLTITSDCVFGLNTVTGCQVGIATLDYVNGTSSSPNDRCLIQGNVITKTTSLGSGHPGIALMSARHGSFVGNIVNESKGPGILLQNCIHMTVTGNTTRENSQGGLNLADGIEVVNSTYCLLSSNQSYGVLQRYGIIEAGTSDNNDFLYNGLSGNKMGAILVVAGTGASSTRVGNRIT